MRKHFEREAKLMVFGPMALIATGILFAVVDANYKSEVPKENTPNCTFRAEMIADAPVPISLEIAEKVKDYQSLVQVLVAMGPAKRDVGSGLLVLEWELTGGGTLQVSSGMNICEKIVGYRFQGTADP